LEACIEFISRQVLSQITVKVPRQAQSETFYNYPFAAVEEAISNAIYHRNYWKDEPIEVRIKPDSLSVISYDGPLPPVTQDTLDKHIVPERRRYRNPYLGDFLKNLRLVEKRATGVGNRQGNEGKWIA
jgi:ATP-dependent DNA helicase RecG